MRAQLVALVALLLSLCTTEGFLRMGSSPRHQVNVKPSTRLAAGGRKSLDLQSSRRSFLFVGRTAALGGALFSIASKARAESLASPGNVVGTWAIEQSGVGEFPPVGELTFEKSGESSLVVKSGEGDEEAGATFLGATSWKVNPARRFPNDPGKLVRFNIEYKNEVLAYSGTIEADSPDVIFGTVEVEDEGGELTPDKKNTAKSIGNFKCKLISAADFVKKKGAFQYDLPENAPTLELNGRARWVVEKEIREKKYAAKMAAQQQQSTTTKSEESDLGEVYIQNPVKLVLEQGYKLQPEAGTDD